MNKELIQKLRAAKSAEELIEIVKAKDVELTKENAEKLFEKFHADGELTDEMLDDVVGGLFSSRDWMWDYWD